MKSDFTISMAAKKLQVMASEIKNEINISKNVENAIAKSPREIFMPRGLEIHAYKLDALPMLGNQWISSPITVAKMTEALQCEAQHKVLEVGCGSGYQALVLSKICKKVYTIERIGHLLNEAKERFRTLRAHNISAKHDDGQLGWKQYAPYDRIMFSASASKIPHELTEQLAIGGIMVVPMDLDGKQTIIRYTKKENGELKKEPLDECLFVPVLDGVQE